MIVKKRIVNKMKNITDNPEHPLHHTTTECLHSASLDIIDHKTLKSKEILPAHSHQHYLYNKSTTTFNFPLGLVKNFGIELNINCYREDGCKHSRSLCYL
ncbi:hypothetical protein XENOCAPTIV_002969 [Xenoophorus captivus]|uniref:Uncharacterized protein n=2 Tax=Goodeidae TaxID=28758 RepID=A0ABV0QY66_9TELE